MRRIVAALLLVATARGVAAAPRGVDPDWPCQQVKIGELSVASVWTGPAIDGATTNWRQSEAVAALVGAVTQRRLPIEDAAQRIADFARAAGEARPTQLVLAFAGIFEVLNAERTKVVSGLDRFGQRQKALAENLREDGETLRAAQASEPQDEAKIAELTQHLLWDQQLFEQRRQSLRFACEIPATIEQRLYALAKIIQHLLD
jgi:hypothetical protein